MFYNKKNVFVDFVVIAYVSAIILFSYAEGKTYLTKIVAIALAILFFYQLFIRGKKLPLTGEWVAVSLWILSAILSSVFAIEPELSLSRIFTVLQVIAVSFMFFSIIVWRGSVNAVWLSFITTMILVSFVSLDDPLTYSDFGRLRGTFNNSNLFGLALLISISGLLYFFSTYTNKFVKLLTIVAMIFFFYMITESGSRKALIMVVMVLGLYSYFIFRETGKKSIVGGMTIGVLGVTALISGVTFIQNSAHYERIQRIIVAIEEEDISKAGGSERGRLQLIKKGFDAIHINPAIGVGLDNFRALPTNNLGRTVGTYSHSNFIELVVGTGIIGLVLYYTMYFLIILRLLRLRSQIFSYKERFLYFLIVVLFAAFFIYDLAMVSYYEKISWVLLATIIASAEILKNRAASPTVDIEQRLVNHHLARSIQ